MIVIKLSHFHAKDHQFIFLKLMTCSRMYRSIDLALPLFFTLSEIPRISPASRTKYYRSLLAHLLVSWASLTFSCEN